MSLTVFWFRRDLRLEDNAGLFNALKEQENVQPLFIFDTEILDLLNDKSDARVTFLHRTLSQLKEKLQTAGSDLWVFHGKPFEIFQKLFSEHKIKGIYTNHDYEPLALERDEKIRQLCLSKGVQFQTFKDQVIFEKNEILTEARKPYTVYTPYKKKWLASLSPFYLKSYPTDLYWKSLNPKRASEARDLPSLQDIGFQSSKFEFPETELRQSLLKDYAERRDFPAQNATSHLGLHLRFGTVSVRELAREGKKHSDVWLSELIWREFFQQILFHFPRVEKESFRPEYEKVAWRNSPEDFGKWCRGETGYPLVDAGMRELNATGYMHNRVRMVTASFLCKHLLIHWYQGERYFASKLLDYDLSANNGNWQWAAGTGCDAAPYFRVFNPETQMEKFDPHLKYVKKWVPEFGTSKYAKPMIEHREGRERALRAFQLALKGKAP